MRKNDNGEKLNMQKLESTKMEYINIIDKQNILYLSDYQKGEKAFQSYLQDTYFVRSQRIPKKGRVLSLTNENFVLYHEHKEVFLHYHFYLSHEMNDTYRQAF